MQAPTTPNGQPAQEPDQRTCPNCGAANGLTAAFCWQCSRPFGAYAAPPGLAGTPCGSPARPGASALRFPAELEEPRGGGGVSRVAAIVLFTVAVIGAAYWFTSSTSFANPAVTIGRAFTDTFAGIAPASLPGFLAAQLAGLLVGAGLLLALYPGAGATAADVVVEHRAEEPIPTP